MKRMYFIYNPHAGRAQIKNNLLDIIDIFVKGGYEVTVHPTQYARDAVETVKNLEKDYYDMLVCSGGDGTLDEVVTGMMLADMRLPLGYIPAGSTNDFANSLKLPKNMKAAAAAIMTGNPFPCDIGSFNEDTFVYIAAFGIFTAVSYETRQQMKNVLGHMAYILEGAKQLTAIKSYEMHIEYNENIIEGDFLFGMVTNSLSVGGFKSITGRNVKLDDGVFEVTLIKRPQNLSELQAIISSLLLEEVDTQYMYTFKSDRLHISAGVEVPWTLDGEFGGSHTDVEICNNMKRLEIFA